MIGCDIVVCSRIEKIYERHKTLFLDKFLSKQEQSYIKNTNTLAGFWAIKEATSKALGVGISKECSFFDIIISKDDKNAPHISFSQKVIQEFKIKSASVSVAHDGGFAIAVVAIETKQG
ncbi:TPA: holo-ACP synthase [Campylobacter lari]|uniref:holo-ACP synthase n=1 Tax=Campylobacter sp. RKI_CA19_01116 TaxID=2911625 RepID=UPI00185A12BB|nr:holo-ACP synthase [Campylobacter sp. RKI_CA19_01116]EAH4571992.1 holo-ACP synthase [Campylobacter lari]EAI7261999.1 holo-ACP synthase [Campylobacter lari]EGK8010264.1 holo-ACP synthase [Campylobacter lari]MCV3396269.1 holo-ACP synthase [Campylobacter sp. RKI_CA19_01116]HEC1780649.1 holo-ACP synthase [Campylobacter lari]